MHKSISAKEIKEALMTMAEVEMAIGKLYRCCAACFPEDRRFWLGLVNQEIRHAKYILKMGKIISKKKDQFEMNRPFNPTAMRTVLSGIKTNMAQVKSRGIPKSRMLAIAHDIEKSLLESNFAEMFKTKDVEYQNLLNEIRNDTAVHKKIIQDKLALQNVAGRSHPAGGLQVASTGG